MRNRLLHSLLSYSKSLPFLPQNPHLTRQIFFSQLTQFVSTSSADNLDPYDPFPMQNNQRVEPVSAQDFAFLTADSGTPSQQVLGAGKFPISAVSIANAVLNNGEFWGRTENFLSQFKETVNEELVVEVLNLLKLKPQLAVKFFIWAGRQTGYSHTVTVFNSLLDLLESGSGNDDRIPEKFLLEIRNDDEKVLKRLLNLLIGKYCKNGLWNMALEELGRLKDFGYKPSRATYCALVQVFLRADVLDTAHLFYREMSDAGFHMDSYTLRCYAYSLCRTGQWKEALSLIEKEEFKPDVVIYTKMIAGLCEASLFEEAMDFLNRMRADSCVPDVVTYRVLLCGCLNKGQLGTCKRILEMMITEGCYPTLAIFDSLVQAYCKSGDYSYAFELLNKMKKCGFRPGYVVYNKFIGGVCGKKELPSSDALELAEKAYSEMFAAGFVLNKFNVSHFARCLCSAGKFEKACKLIHEMMHKGFIPDTSTYSKVINHLCKAKKVENAFLLFVEMKKNGVVPDVHTYTILIDSFCKAGLIEQARNWFDEMVKGGCAPTVVTYTALIHAYLKARQVSKADELFEMMLSKGCIPNVVTYTALIDGHCKAGQTEKACQIYARMHTNEEIPDVDLYFKAADDDAKTPNVYTYGALVDGLCKIHKVKDAHDLLEAMSGDGCEPNHVVYGALIDGFCKAGKLDKALEVFSKMSEQGFSPNTYVYSSLITRLSKDNRLDLALKVLSKMLENSCTPNVVIYTEIINGLCKAGKTDEAYKLMLMMEEKGCNPNVRTYNVMIDGFGKAGRIDKSLELLEQMGPKGVAPNFMTYRVLINHCCIVGLLDKAYELLEEMKQTQWPTHMAGYRKVIEELNKEFIMSHGLLDEVGKSESLPVIPSYRVLMNNFIKAGRLDVALQLHHEIASFSQVSEAYYSTYNALIVSLSLARKVNKAFELYAEMTRMGGVPELSTFIHLVKGLIAVNKWEEALQLSDSFCQMDIQWLRGKETPDAT
ncbi:hypothetical protein GQ457_01G034490 [Hibiscus cannabinus]